MKKKPKFFIVDDDRGAIDIQTLLLESAGYEVSHETDSLEALSRIKREAPDCILIDVMMPGMDGLELCGKLRREKSLAAAKIIIVSAKQYEFDRRRAYESGADGYIVKPIDRETFVAKIEEILADRIAMTFWGVRGTLPVPGKRTVRYGGNTSCVSLSFPKGDLFIFDAGSGIKELSNRLLADGVTRLNARIFISHPHWDHINAIPFFVPFYIQGNEIEICGASHGDLSMEELISNQMDGVYFPVTISEFAARVRFRDLREEKIRINGVEIETMLLSHPGYCLGYRVNYRGRSVCYVTDNELFLPDAEPYNPHFVDRLTRFVKGADFLVTDATYFDEDYKTKVGWGHSSVSQVVDFAHGAEVKTLCLFHHDPDQDDDAIDRKRDAAAERLAKLGSRTKCLAPAEGDNFKI